MNLNKIYIYGKLGLHHVAMDAFRDHGYTVLHGKDDDETDFLKSAMDAQVIIMADDVFKTSWFDQLPSLKLIIRRGVGYDKIPVAVATQHGVVVANTPGANAVSVAEIAVGLMFETVRKIPQARDFMHQFNGRMYPSSLLSHSLNSRTIGLVGYGNIAQATEQMLSGFDARILVTAHHQQTPKIGRYVGLATLLAESDIVSLHLPATKETTGMFNRDVFEQMKNDAILINTSRGALVNEHDLVSAVEHHEIGGAGLDTTMQEPMTKESELLNHDQIILAPHIGGFTIEAEIKTAKMVAQNAIDLFDGQRPRYAVN